MENNLLYCYKDWLEKEEGTLFKKIFKIPIKIHVLLASLIIVLVAFFIFGFLSDRLSTQVQQISPKFHQELSWGKEV